MAFKNGDRVRLPCENQAGVVVDCQGGCYEVLLDDGNQTYFEPHELDEVPLADVMQTCFKPSELELPHGILKGTRAYLAGPIDLADPTHNWRPEVKATLRNRFGIKVFDPFADPKQANVEELNRLTDARDYEGMRRIVKKFVRADLSIVDHADLVVAHLPYKVPTTGTTHEVIQSNSEKKPTLLVCPQGKHLIPRWFFGYVPLHFLFGSWEELFAYLAEVDAGRHADDDRWWFVSNYGTDEWLR